MWWSTVVFLGRPCLIVFVSLSLPLIIMSVWHSKKMIVADTAIGFGFYENQLKKVYLNLQFMSAEELNKQERRSLKLQSMMATNGGSMVKKRSSMPNSQGIYIYIYIYDHNIIIYELRFCRSLWKNWSVVVWICRNYYRCTHRDQGCQATKQVQRVQEDPILYKTIYYGEHSCKSLTNPEIILDPMSPSSSSKFLSFNNSFPTPSKQDCPFLSSSFPSSSVKRECKEEIPPSTSSNDYLISSDLTFDGSPKHVTLSSSTLDSEYKAVDIPDVFDDVFEHFFEFR